MARPAFAAGAGMFYDSRQAGIFNNRFVDVTPVQPSTYFHRSARTVQQSAAQGSRVRSRRHFRRRGYRFPAAGAGHHLGAHGSIQGAGDVQLEPGDRAPGGPNWLVRAAYVGSHSSHLIGSDRTQSRRLHSGQHAVHRSTAHVPGISSSSRWRAWPETPTTIPAVELWKSDSRSGFTLTANYTWAKS